MGRSPTPPGSSVPAAPIRAPRSAERQLRPAAISRKLSCGNKTEQGVGTWQVLASLAATCRQTGSSFADFLVPRLTLSPTLV